MPRLLLVTTAHSYRNAAFQAAAERAGVELVTAVDMPAAAPIELRPKRQDVLPVPLDDPAAAAAAIAAFAAHTPLSAILPVDDSGVIAAAAAAAQLGLPHNAPAAASAARDKLLMRTLMAAAGVPCPWFQAFDTGCDPALVAVQVPYPCVLKPTSLNGSRGVMRADTPQEFIRRAQRLARLLASEFGPGPQPYLVESFIPGGEVALEGMLDGGKLHVLALFDKPDPLDGPFFEETIYVTPSRLPGAVQEAVAAATAAAATAIGLHTGPIHAELRTNAQGPWLLEVAGRSIGGLCGRTLRFGFENGAGSSMGISLEELIVRQACGLPWSAGPVTAAGGAGGVMMIPIPEAGILTSVEGVDRARAVLGIEEVEISAPLHQSITPLPEGQSYLGFIFARGDTPAQVETALRLAHACLRFHIAPEFGLNAAGAPAT
jgi:biotin carboxylase